MNNTSPAEIWLTVVLVVIVMVVLFIVFRELVCWYWKINRTVALLTEIRDLLARGSGTNLIAGGASSDRVEPTFQSMAAAADKDTQGSRDAATRLARSGHSVEEIVRELQRWRGLSADEAREIANTVKQ